MSDAIAILAFKNEVCFVRVCIRNVYVQRQKRRGPTLSIYSSKYSTGSGTWGTEVQSRHMIIALLKWDIPGGRSLEVYTPAAGLSDIVWVRSMFVSSP